MKVAEVSTLYESVPPKLYGGTERVVSYLTEELVNQGHEVTLFASGDSVTRARLVPCCDEALRLNRKCVDPLPHHFLMLETVCRRLGNFDVVHFHTDYLHFPVMRRCRAANVTTLHGRLDIPDLAPLYLEFADVPLVSISESQRRPLPWANWQGTVYHGLPDDLYSPQDGRGGYLAVLGRVSPEKRVDWAIEAARHVGTEVRIAAKIDRVDRDYFHEVVEPLFRQPHVNYVGEIGDDQKGEFLGNAAALLFPVDWEEPFGLVQIEAMACGTPVVALRRGSVPEVIDHGVTGFVCDTLDEMVEAVSRVPQLSRRRCRQVFEERFTAARMASDYVKVFERVAGEYHTDGRDHPGRRPALHPGHLAAGGRAVARP